MTDRLLALRVFQRVARRGSFTGAARELGLSQPSVSRIVAALEAEMGVSLVARSTRGLSLSDTGRDYLARIEPVLDALDEADHAARGTGALHGRLRVGLSSSFGVRELIPRLPEFLDSHPALSLDLVVDDARRDLVTDGVHLAFRLGPLADSSAIARKLGEAPRLLIASPDYLRRAGVPAAPADLALHSVIVGPGASSSVLEFRQGDHRVQVPIRGRICVAANEAATAAAVAGLGISITSLWGCREELARQQLVPVLPDWQLPRVELHAIYPPGRAISAAARALVDYLAPRLTDTRDAAGPLSRRR